MLPRRGGRVRQVIDGIEVIHDRAPPVRRADPTDAPPLPVWAGTPRIAPPMLLEPEPEPDATPAPAPEVPTLVVAALAPAEEPADAWFDGTLSAEEPRAVPASDRRWLVGAAVGLGGSVALLALFWLAAPHG